MGEGHTRWTSSHTDLRSEPALPVWPLFYTLQTYQIPRRSGAQPTFSFSFFFFRFCICWSAYHTQFTKSLKQPGYRQQIFPDLVRRSALPGSPLWSFLAPASDPTQGELEDLTRLLRNLVWSSSTPVFFLHFEIDYHLIL